MYLRAAKTEAEEAGEATDGMASSVSELREKILDLTGQKVDVLIDDDTFKSTYQILKELSGVWDSISDTSQANLLEMLGGKRNANAVSAILENFEIAQKALESAGDAAGSALAENEKYLDSIDGRLQKLKATFEELSTAVVDSELIKLVIGAGTFLLNILNGIMNVVNAFGGLKTVLLGVAAALAITKAEWIATNAVMLVTTTITKLISIFSMLKQAIIVMATKVVEAGLAWRAFAAHSISAGAAVQATIPVIGVLLAIITAVVGAVSLANTAIEDNRQEIKQAAESAASLSDEISTLTMEYVRLSESVGENEDSIEGLNNTKDDLIAKLKIERSELRQLTDEYGNLDDAMKRAAANKLASSREDLVNNLDGMQFDIDEVVEGLDNRHYNFTAGSLLFPKQHNDYDVWVENASALDALFEEWSQLKSLAYVVADADYQKHISTGEMFLGNYNLNLDEVLAEAIGGSVDDLSTIAGLTQAKTVLEDMMSVVKQSAGTHNTIYSDLNNAYKSITSTLSDYSDAVEKINSNLVQEHMAVKLIGRDVPKTQEDFDAYRQSVIDSVTSSKEFVGSTDDIANAVDGILSKDVSFADFYKTQDDGVKKFTATVTNLSEAISKLKQAESVLAQAEEDMANGGGLTLDTIQALASATADYIDYLYIENGALKLNTEAWNEYAKSQMVSQVEIAKDNIRKLEEKHEYLVSLLNELANNASEEYMLSGEYDADAAPILRQIKENKADLEQANDELKKFQHILNMTSVPDGLVDILNVFDKISESIDSVNDRLSTLTDAFSKLSDGSLNTWEVIELLQKFPELAPYVDLNADGFGDLSLGIQDLLMHTPDEFIKTMQQFRDTNDLTEEAVAQIDALCLAVSKLSFEELFGLSSANTKDGWLGTISSVQRLEDGFSQLSEIFADIKDRGDFDWSSILNNSKFDETFGSLGDAYKYFIATITSSPDDIDACRGAFSSLATEYVRTSGALKGLTNDSADAVIALLEQMGVTNATAIVQEQFAIQKLQSAYAAEEYVNKTYDQVYALYLECDAASEAKQALAMLAIEKKLADDNPIDTFGEINQLFELAEAAGATEETFERLGRAKNLISDLYFTISQADEAYRAGDMDAWNAYIDAIASIRTQIEGLLSGAFEYGSISVEVDWSDILNTDEETWFEKAYKEHQHLLNIDQENAADYLAWLNENYQKAYAENIITLDEYRQYCEEVYDGLHDLFMDHLNDVEHEISILERSDNEFSKIISLYKQLMDEVDAEIKAAREAGLDDTDDYIQELLDKWWGYSDSLQDIYDEATENAKSAVDELVDYRLDMIKQDIENEKDALDKKLSLLSDFYDKQKKMLQKQKDEEEYIEEQAEKRNAISDLKAELAMLEHDDSAWAQKRKLELRAELSDAEDELRSFEKDHAYDTTINILDEAYEAQKAQIEMEMQALEDLLNDPYTLFNQALNDIKNNTGVLYAAMIAYNRKYGTGNDEDVITMFEDAFKALGKYEDVYGDDYNGIRIPDYTSAGSGAQTGGSNAQPDSPTGGGSNAGNTPPNAGTSAPVAPTLEKGSYVQVKDGAKWYADSYGGGAWGYAKSGKIEYVNPKGTHPYSIDGGGWVRKEDIVGYAGGTKSATAGIHEFGENGDEYIFTSADGSRYRIFQNGEKVLNARSTNFLYDFATTRGSILTDAFDALVGEMLRNVGHIMATPSTIPNVITGDIIIQGNTNERTVSEIRRAQRDQVSYILREFNKLSR